jgi:Pyruvate/2-oxoacid:ferredoxin oxidoreductase delta subunit
MSRSKRAVEKVYAPPRPHVKLVRCVNCGERFPEGEISVEVDEATKQVIGRYCGGCL